MKHFDPSIVLMKHGIRPSRQRKAILQFLSEHPTHPTAEDVYQALYKKIKTLSRTTVYNTLRLFCSNGAAQMITLEENEMRFDATTNAHGHFKCSECGKIFDFPCEAVLIETPKNLPNGFQPQETQLYVHGLCSECNSTNEAVSCA